MKINYKKWFGYGLTQGSLVGFLLTMFVLFAAAMGGADTGGWEVIITLAIMIGGIIGLCMMLVRWIYSKTNLNLSDVNKTRVLSITVLILLYLAMGFIDPESTLFDNIDIRIFAILAVVALIGNAFARIVFKIFKWRLPQ